MNRSRWLSPVALCAALGIISACTPPKTVKKTDTPQNPEATAVSTGPVTAPSVEVGEANIRGTDFTAVPELQNIQFDYDSYTLTDGARAILKSNAEYLKAHSNLTVQVSGHCDERGTIQYNLGLGQRRAKAARDYYMKLGVSGKSIATISYGKEKPMCQEHNDDCWAKNRRSETLVRAPAVSKGT